MASLEEIKGIINSIIYYNNFNGYTIADLNSGGELITIIGFFPELQEGEEVSLTGKWVTHREYGLQFKVETFNVSIPSSIEAIEKYLSSGLIKGIGPVIAKRMVRHFGKDTLDIIQFHPSRLTEIVGIGEKTAKKS